MTFVPDKLTGDKINSVTNKYIAKYVLWIHFIRSSFSEGLPQGHFLKALKETKLSCYKKRKGTMRAMWDLLLLFSKSEKDS